MHKVQEIFDVLRVASFAPADDRVLVDVGAGIVARPARRLPLTAWTPYNFDYTLT
jgi:hypothetical protein